MKQQEPTFKQFSTCNIAHISTFAVNCNLIILSKPKCIVISTDLFVFSLVVRGTSHFYSFFRKWFWQELIFGMTTMAFGLGKPSPGQYCVALIIVKITFKHVMFCIFYVSSAVAGGALHNRSACKLIHECPSLFNKILYFLFPTSR